MRAGTHAGIMASRPNGLGDILPNVLAVHSFRKLCANYAGPCFTVRRALDNALLDVYFVNGYADTAALLAFLSGSNGFVTTFYDQKKGNHITQATTTKQARVLLVTVGSNTFLGLRHTGGHQLTAPIVSAVSSINVGAINTVTANSSGNSSGFIAGWGQFSPAAVRMNYMSSNKYNSAAGGVPSNFDTTIAETVNATFTTVFNRNNPGANTGTIDGYVNGVQKVAATGVPLQLVTNFNTHIGQSQNNTDGFKGDVLEVIRFDNTISASDIINVLQANQKTYYGI